MIIAKNLSSFTCNFILFLVLDLYPRSNENGQPSKWKQLKTIWVSPFKTKKKQKSEKTVFFIYFGQKRIHFRTQKRSFKKAQKIEIFQRGQSMVLVTKIELFTMCAFLANQERKDRFQNNILDNLDIFQEIQAREMSFKIFQNKKTPFQAIKKKNSQTRKIDIFPKGLTHGFGPNMAIFPTFFFRQYKAGKCLLLYFRTKKRLSRL